MLRLQVLCSCKWRRVAQNGAEAVEFEHANEVVNCLLLEFNSYVFNLLESKASSDVKGMLVCHPHQVHLESLIEFFPVIIILVLFTSKQSQAVRNSKECASLEKVDQVVDIVKEGR